MAVLLVSSNLCSFLTSKTMQRSSRPHTKFLRSQDIHVELRVLALMFRTDLCSQWSGHSLTHVSFALLKFRTPVLLQHKITYNMQLRSHALLPSQQSSSSRRQVLVYGVAPILTILSFNYGLMPSLVLAEDKSNRQEEKEDAGVIGAIKSLFDPNEKTKSGKVLPKAYLKLAREVVKNLRESLKEDSKDLAKFRRTADAAKESIREYLSNWQGQQTVAQEDSYVELEKAIRALASFYSKAGPSAALPEEIKSEILNDLNTAEQSL